MCMYVYFYVGVCTWMQVPSEARDVSCPGSGVTGGCELPDLETGTQTQVLFKGSLCFQSLRHLSSTFFKIVLQHMFPNSKRMKKRETSMAVSVSTHTCEQ